MKRDRTQGGLSRRDFIKGAAAGAAVAATGTGLIRSTEAARAPTVTPPVCLTGSGDIALINGRFLTLDKNNTIVGAVTIRNGRFAEIGTVGTLGPCSQTIDLQGRTVIPGLIDDHVHFIRTGTNPGHEVRIIETATSIAELQQMISNRIQELSLPPGEFVTCMGGWNRNGLTERRLPTLSELNAAAPQHPLFLAETGGGGQAVTNSAGSPFFQARGVTVNASTGVLNSAQGFAALQAAQTEAEKLRGTAENMDFAASVGVTMVHDAGQSAFTFDTLAAQYQYAVTLWQQGKLTVRHRLYFNTGNDTGISAMQGRIINNIIRMGDDLWRLNGVGESMLTPRTSPLFIDGCKYAAANGWTLTTHSLLVAENQFQVAAFQAANAEHAIRDLRWSLAHVNSITPDLVQALIAMGAAVTLEGWQYTSTSGGPPYRLLFDSGIHMGGGTDSANVGPFNPWLMIYYMTTGKNNAGTVINPGQQLTRLEALKTYTSGSAWLSFDDDKLGTIETGKLADLAVLSADPLTVSDDGLKKIHSVLTLQAGKVVHSSSS
jgi:predicted amidohydrolase YtcJ